MLQAGVIWNLCNLENKIISVERILQYTKIASEPPLKIEANQPDFSWPSNGEVEIRNLQVLVFFFIYLFSHFLLCMFGKKTMIVFISLGSICPELATCAARHKLHFHWRNENRHCWKNRERKIDSHTDAFSDCRPCCWQDYDRWHRHFFDWAARFAVEFEYHPSRSNHVPRLCKKQLGST